MKKGELVMSKLGTIILIAILMIVLLMVMYFMREEMMEVWYKIYDFMRFGG